MCVYTPCTGKRAPIQPSPDHTAHLIPLLQIRERLGVSLGERPPTLVPVTHVMMCMNCGCDFSLTLRRHHCHACGKVSHTHLGECVHRAMWGGVGIQGHPAVAVEPRSGCFHTNRVR